MKKSMQKSGSTIAPLTARAASNNNQGARETSQPGARETSQAGAREGAVNPWLSKRVAQRLEEGRTLLLDMAADLPFTSVLRGRVAPPREDVLAQAEPLARVVQQFTPQTLGIAIDANYIRERRAVIDLLGEFEKAGENFLGLIRRTRAVMAAQLEKAMRGAYATAAEAAANVPDLPKALAPLAPVLGQPKKK